MDTAPANSDVLIADVRGHSAGAEPPAAAASVRATVVQASSVRLVRHLGDDWYNYKPKAPRQYDSFPLVACQLACLPYPCSYMATIGPVPC